MKYKLLGCILLVTSFAATAQVASHTPSGVVAPAAASVVTPLQISDKPVARVNGAVLTDRDLLREMYTIFPYARQHNGFPKSQEAAIRQGALEMIIFEELVYQEAQRRKLVVPATKLNVAEGEFRKQFSSPDEYKQYLQAEMQGSEQKVKQQIRRSLLIEQVLKTDVEMRATITPAELQAYYVKNGARFQQAESFGFQSISIIPPLKATPQQQSDAKKRADAALAQVKTAKNYEDFGLLAEKVSEDDFRVNMGDHKITPADKLPPQVVKFMRTAKPGQVSGLIQIENAYTIVRATAYTPARKQPFTEVKASLKDELQKAKYERLRSGLAKQLRAKAKIEVG
jgi:parvulin-like peptidyl-prolyl isomerase